MTVKHKVQRKVYPTFQAELNLCILCGPTTWWQWVVCAGSGDGLWRWLSGAHLLGRCNCGIRGRVGISTSGLQWAVQCCSLRPPWWSGCGWGLWVLWLWGWASGPPVCMGLHRRAPKPLGIRRFSQNPAFTLPASELLLVLFFYLRVLCPRLRIQETTEKPTPIQTHVRLFTSSSLCPSIPNRVEQGLGSWGGF